MKTTLVTGGAGFIGSNFVLGERARGEVHVVTLDRLTYAGNLMNLESLKNDPHHTFIRGDIGDRGLVHGLLHRTRPSTVVHFAAESHVDRSIHAPADFIQTNIVGTFHLLQEVQRYWDELSEEAKRDFRFLHVSTDEVYGSLGPHDPPFHERSPYAPNSPYAASKAASDHLVRAQHHTYGLPVLITNCSNNYGPRQYPEKLIPLMILNACRGKPLPIYGDGKQVRDWLYVQNHGEALRLIVERGRAGETYHIGGGCEKTNLDVVKAVCRTLDALRPESPHVPHESLITFIEDRPGHDRRYAMDTSKVQKDLGWMPRESFESGLEKTIRWYLDHSAWVASVQTGSYRQWLDLHYGRH